MQYLSDLCRYRWFLSCLHGRRRRKFYVIVMVLGKLMFVEMMVIIVGHPVVGSLWRSVVVVVGLRCAWLAIHWVGDRYV